MAQKLKNFSDLSADYSTLQVAQQQVAQITQKLADYTTQLNDLTTQKNNLVSLKQLQQTAGQAVFNQKVQQLIDQQIQDMDDKIAQIQEEVKNIRDTDLYKQKDSVQNATAKLDYYIQTANTNYEFRRVVHEQILRDIHTRINEIQAEQSKPNAYVTFIEKLEDTEQNDSDLKDLLQSIDKDKSELGATTLGISQLEALRDQATDPRQKANFESIINNMKSEETKKSQDLSQKSDKLKQYVSDHREDFGLPAGTDPLNFDDLTSPLYMVSAYLDPKGNKTLTDLKSDYAGIMTISQDKIDELNKLNRFLDYVEHDLDNISEVGRQNLYIPFATKLKTMFINLKNRIVSSFKGEKKPKKIQSPPMGAKVTGSHSDFINSIHTPIGEDAIAQVTKKYQERYAKEQQQSQQQDTDQTR